MQSIWSCQRAFGCWLHLPDAPSGCPKRSEGGSPATARRKCAGVSLTKQVCGGASKRLKGRQPPSPSSSLCRYRARKPHAYGTGAECFTQGAGGVSSAVIPRARSGACLTKQVWRSQQKVEKATAPSPSSSLCRYRAPKPRPYGTGAECFTQGAGGMVSSAVTSGCPKRSEGGSPVGTRRNTIPPQTKKMKT